MKSRSRQKTPQKTARSGRSQGKSGHPKARQEVRQKTPSSARSKAALPASKATADLSSKTPKKSGGQDEPSLQSLKQVQMLDIDSDRAGQRIDNFLLSILKGVPKTLIYRVIRKGEVRVNKGRVKAEYKLREGDLVRVPPVRLPEPEAPQKASDALLACLSGAVVYEDAGLLIIDKPAGLAVHAGSGIKVGLIEALRQLREADHYLELIHRLDRGTSGLVMIAKKRSMLRHMQQLLREKSLQGRSGGVVKIYQALAVGAWPNKGAGQVDLPLLKVEQPSGECVVKVRSEGKPSKTLFKLLSRHRFANVSLSLLEARPITGRTHQIRVHAQSQGCALLGDEKYGDDVINKSFKDLGYGRMFLHASMLRFVLPDGQQVEVSAPTPKLWSQLLASAGGKG